MKIKHTFNIKAVHMLNNQIGYKNNVETALLALPLLSGDCLSSMFFTSPWHTDIASEGSPTITPYTSSGQDTPQYMAPKHTLNCGKTATTNHMRSEWYFSLAFAAVLDDRRVRICTPLCMLPSVIRIAWATQDRLEYCILGACGKPL